MGTLKTSTAPSLQVAKTPSLPNDVVRLSDLDAAIANTVTPGQLESLGASIPGAVQITGDAAISVGQTGPDNFQITQTLLPNGIIQAAQSGLQFVQSVAAAWTEISLGYQQVVSVTVTRNLISGGTVIATGAAGVDYFLDAFSGTITIPPSSDLINSSESPQVSQIQVAFGCSEIDSGSALQKIGGSSGGLSVVFGDGHNQVPSGDTVQNLVQKSHLPASPDPAAETTTTTVDALQRVRTEVNVAPGGNIVSSSDGIGVNLPGVVSAVLAQIPDATESNDGLMTQEQVTALDQVANAQSLNFEDSDSINLSKDGDGNVTANIIPGVGIMVGAVSVTGDTAVGQYEGENIWYDLSISPSSWPTGWPNVVYWGIANNGTNTTFSIYSDAGGATLLASGLMPNTAFTSPQIITLHDTNSNPVGTITLNTTAASPVSTVQTIVLTPTGVSVDLSSVAQKQTTDFIQEEVSALQAAGSSDGGAISTLQTQVAALETQTLTGQQLDDFNCLTTLEEKFEFARRLFPSVRLENPALGSYTGGNASALFLVPPRLVGAGGSGSDVYTIDLRIRGVARLENVWPATPMGNYAGDGSVVVGGNRAVKNGLPYVVTLPSLNPIEEAEQPSDIQDIENAIGEMVAESYVDVWSLTISDDGTGNEAIYYLNAAATSTESAGGPALLDYTLSNVTIKGGATITLQTTSAGTVQSHVLVPPDVPPIPSYFTGYFVQIDALDVQSVCPLGDIAGDGQVDGIGIYGQNIRKDLGEIYGGSTGTAPSLNGYPGLNGGVAAPGWNGLFDIPTDGADTGTGNGLDSTTNQPIFSLPRDLLRLGVMDGGNADDSVYDILINGRDIWVSGAFSRWGNIACPGLVRLDHLGRLSWSYVNFKASFSEPVRHLGLTADGNVLAASLLPSMYQNQNSVPVHKILHDGTEDVTFSCPDGIAINDGQHQNVVIDVCGLSDGKVAVLTPRCLTVLNANGTIFSQQDSSGTDMFLALLSIPGTPSLLLSSHAWSTPLTPCDFNGALTPRGLKLLDEAGSNFQIDSTWTNPAYVGYPNLGAGTGAMASCMRSIIDPTGSFFIVGNGLERYNGVDTSWNIQMTGNLVRYSESISTAAAWPAYGSLSVTGSGTVPAGVTGNSESFILANAGGIGYTAFLQQSIQVAAQTNVVLQFYLKKQSLGNFAIVQMQFAGSSSGASSAGGGGTSIEAYAWLDPSGTNPIPYVENVSGNANATVTMVQAPTDSGWWLVTMQLPNSSPDTDLNVTIFPAYANVWRGTSTSVTGSIQISAPEVRYDFWSSIYVPTTSSQVLPSSSSSNSSRFEGLYKILYDGAADPSFNCQMTYSTDDGMAIPFAIDGHGNIYCGGPISTIMDPNGNHVAVTPWMLYKLNSNGQFLEEFSMFDDDVLVMRITPYGNFVVGGKFQFYGSFACGRFVMIDPSGNLIRDPERLDDPVVFGSSAPDTIQLPGLKNKEWIDAATDPPGLYVWSPMQNNWVQSAVGGMTQLPPVSISASPNVPPTQWAPGSSGFDGSTPLSLLLSEGISGSSIYYTLDGSDPRIASNPSRTLYPSNASVGTYPQISEPTVVSAYATKAGYTDSVLSVVTYGQQLAPPVISPPSENLVFPVSISIAGPVGAAIYYTVDGSDPRTSDTASLYSGGFTVGAAGSASAVVRAAAIQSGYFASNVVQTNYGDNLLPGITFSPATGTPIPATVTIGLPSTFTASYSIIYTTSTTGSAPDPVANPLLATTVQGPATISAAVGTSIAAYAIAPGWTPSPTSYANYGLAIVNAPTITQPAAGSGTGVIIITADPTGPVGQTIWYSINSGGFQSQASPAGIDLSDIAGTNGNVTVSAYSSFSGWGNSPTTSATFPALLLSGLINVNFSPTSAPAKVGRMALWSNPFSDVWNKIAAQSLIGLASLDENFYSGAVGFAKPPGGITTSLSFSQNSGGTFGTIPAVGDNAYKNFLEVTATSVQTNQFVSTSFGYGQYYAVTNGGQVFVAPDGVNWTETQNSLPQLTRVVSVNVPSVPSTTIYTTVVFQYNIVSDSQPSNMPFNSQNIPNNVFGNDLPDGYTLESLTASGVLNPPTVQSPGNLVLYSENVTAVYSGPSSFYGPTYHPSYSVFENASAAINLPSYEAMFICGSGILLTSTDGSTWTNITGNLPSTFTVNDVAVKTQSGSAQIYVVGTAGRQFTAAAGSTSWTEITPTSNLGATLNSIATSVTAANQNEICVGDAGTVLNTDGTVLQLNGYDENSFTRVVVNNLVGQFCFVSRQVNGVTKTYLNSTAAPGTFAAGGTLPSGVTNLHDVAAFQYGFVAVGDDKILLGSVSGEVLTWTDITPIGGTGSSSGGGSWGSSSSGSSEGPVPFLFKGVCADSFGNLVVCGNGGIIVGYYNGTRWVWDWTNQQSNPSLANSDLIQGTFSNLTPGVYDLLIYGHGAQASQNASFHAYVDGVQVKDINGNLSPSTAEDGSFDNTNWQVGRQYVEFSAMSTLAGTIKFGVAPSGASGSSIYFIREVQWTEWGDGNGTGTGTFTPTTDGSNWNSLAFSGGWPSTWPNKIYYKGAGDSVNFYSDPSFSTLLGGASRSGSGSANVTNTNGQTIGQINFIASSGNTYNVTGLTNGSSYVATIASGENLAINGSPVTPSAYGLYSFTWTTGMTVTFSGNPGPIASTFYAASYGSNLIPNGATFSSGFYQFFLSSHTTSNIYVTEPDGQLMGNGASNNFGPGTYPASFSSPGYDPYFLGTDGDAVTSTAQVITPSGSNLLSGQSYNGTLTSGLITAGIGFGNFVGAEANQISYYTTTFNPGVASGSEIFALDVIGAITTTLTSPHPTGAGCQRSATRFYLTSVENQEYAFINALQLSRREGSEGGGVPMVTPTILPETLDNLPFPAVAGGIDLVGIFLGSSDVSLGIAPIAKIYYSIVNCTYSQYETYLASGASGAGLPADPTPTTGGLYVAPFAIADNGIGVLVRAIATCIGRGNSQVAAAFYWPKWPESSSGGGQI